MCIPLGSRLMASQKYLRSFFFLKNVKMTRYIDNKILGDRSRLTLREKKHKLNRNFITLVHIVRSAVFGICFRSSVLLQTQKSLSKYNQRCQSCYRFYGFINIFVQRVALFKSRLEDVKFLDEKQCLRQIKIPYLITVWNVFQMSKFTMRNEKI